MTRIRKAVILAAGLGKRLYPLTKAQPKEMLPILDRPVIHYVVNEAIDSGLDEILIVIGRGKDAIVNYFDKNELDKTLDRYHMAELPELYYVRQREPLGTADALRCAEKFVNNQPFVMFSGDQTCVSSTRKTVARQLLDVFEDRGKNVMSLAEVPRSMVHQYGIIDGKRLSDGVWQIRRIAEKPSPAQSPTTLANVGTYVFRPEIFGYIRRVKRRADGEYKLTDALQMLAWEQALLGCRFKGRWYDIGTMESWVKTFVEFAKDRNLA